MLQDLAPSFFCETLPFTLRVSQHGIEVHCKRLQTWITLEIVRCADTPSRSFCLSRRKHRTHFVLKRRIQPRATASSTATPDNRGGQICKRPTLPESVTVCASAHVLLRETRCKSQVDELSGNSIPRSFEGSCF